MYVWTLLFPLTSLSLAAAPNATACADALAAVGDGYRCAASANGVALSTDQAQANALLGFAETGEAEFRVAMGREAPRYAVVEIEGTVLDESKQNALRAAGFTTVLPWFSPAAYRMQVEASVRRAIEQQAATANLPVEQIDALVQSQVSRIPDVGSPESLAARAAVVIPHELGHSWYRQSFWPGAEATRGHYGSPGPDWLDEAAAVRMEPATSYADRLNGFWARYRRDPVAATTSTDVAVGIANLRIYFDSAHPLAERARSVVDAEQLPGGRGTSGSRIVLRTGAEAERIAGDGIRYYEQGAIVARYLAERSGDAAILGRIGAAFGRGETIDQWLANAEDKGQLPRSVSEMQPDWEAWLAANLPPPPGN